MSSTKKLFIIRHAKSSWKDSSLLDIYRPLNKRGKRNASLMGKRLKKRAVFPDVIISSPAKRAKATAESIAKEIGYKKEILFDASIYASDYQNLHKIIKNVDEKHEVLFIIGHNPELNMLAKCYVGFDENIVTCGIVEIEFDTKKWMKISSKNAKLISFDYPKNINSYTK